MRRSAAVGAIIAPHMCTYNTWGRLRRPDCVLPCANCSRCPPDTRRRCTCRSRSSRVTAGSRRHKDGWGIAWYDERDIRLIKEASPACRQRRVRFIQENPFAARFALSHVRKATQGAVALRNCQPFVREMGGAWHCLAHNGDLAGIDAAMPNPTGDISTRWRNRLRVRVLCPAGTSTAALVGSRGAEP